MSAFDFAAAALAAAAVLSAWFRGRPWAAWRAALEARAADSTWSRLLTCPFCLSFYIAGGAAGGWSLLFAAAPATAAALRPFVHALAAAPVAYAAYALLLRLDP